MTASRTVTVTVVPTLSPEAVAALETCLASIQSAISDLEVAASGAALRIQVALRRLREQETTDRE